MKKLLIFLASIFFMTPAVFAVPAVQVYIPGADWDASTQTWITYSSDFELQVITSSGDTKPIYNLTLVTSLGPDETPTDGAISINGIDYNDFTYGTPPEFGDNASGYPPHGTFPANYFELELAALVNDAPHVVMDMQPGEDGTDMGRIFILNISTSYENVHFDAHGFYREIDGKFTFAPFSHDGQKTIPEPGTLTLFGLGIAGAGIYRRFKK
ncbi:MAG: choice-of-anchor N protein [candidate division Zixibacteria bacterium]